MSSTPSLPHPKESQKKILVYCDGVPRKDLLILINRVAPSIPITLPLYSFLGSIPFYQFLLFSMDLGGVGIMESLDQKSILVTGSTGFLAKGIINLKTHK